MLEGPAVGRHGLGDRIDGMADCGRVMGRRYNERRRQDSPGQKFLQDQGTELLAWLSLLIPGHIYEVAVAATKLEVRTQPSVTHNLLDISAQSCTDPVQLLSDSLLIGCLRPADRKGTLTWPTTRTPR